MLSTSEVAPIAQLHMKLTEIVFQIKPAMPLLRAVLMIDQPEPFYSH